MKIIPDSELLQMARSFLVGYLPVVNGHLVEPDKHPTWVKGLEVYVKNMGNPDNGPDRWGIIQGECCLSKDGNWEYQPLNSNKDESFYELCRFSSIHEAIFYFRYWYKVISDWAIEQLANQKPLGKYPKLPLGFKDAIATAIS